MGSEKGSLFYFYAMNNAICLLPVIPVRAEASHKSEQTTQMLFADTARVLESAGEWTRVRMDDDGYEGWVQSRQLTSGDLSGGTNQCSIITEPLRIIAYKNGTENSFLIPAGCALPPDEEFTLAGARFSWVKTARDGSVPAGIEQLAKSYLHVPYQWGGRTHFGIDCSGFAQVVYKMLGRQLPRDAWQQAETGRVVDFLQEIRSGDLAFFDNEEGRITHVGLMLDPETIIHASASVRIDRMDNQGIYADDLKTYSHKLRIVKRIMESA